MWRGAELCSVSAAIAVCLLVCSPWRAKVMTGYGSLAIRTGTETQMTKESSGASLGNGF
jgi:hypothetical protein